MLQTKVKEIDSILLDKILTDAFYWLVEVYGDKSVVNNITNYTKKHSRLKRVTSKHGLKFSWSRKHTQLCWYYYGQFAEYNALHNTIYVYAGKNQTLEFVLDSLFHEYKHSQQKMIGYEYFRNVLHVAYTSNPLEVQACDFAKENIEKFWKLYSKTLAK